jgi:hypothetical protein
MLNRIRKTAEYWRHHNIGVEDSRMTRDKRSGHSTTYFCDSREARYTLVYKHFRLKGQCHENF